MSEPEATLTPLGGGAFLVARPDGTHRIAYGVADGPRTWVFLDGITHVLEPSRRHRPGAGEDKGTLAAPMPATVTHIHVEVGQAVAASDLLVTLEAMKMELPIRATVGGIVTTINCRVGELVQAGVPLVDVQPRHDPEPEREPEHEPRTGNREA